MQEQQQEIPQRIMGEIHRLVQKLKEGGMSVNSTVETITTVVDDTVKYTDKLTITGDFEKVRFDPRPVTEVKQSLLEQKIEVETKVAEEVEKIDEVITKLDAKPTK